MDLGGVSLDNITATPSQILSGYKSVDKEGNYIDGTMPNLTNNASITHATGNGTKVVLGDAAFISTNTDGKSRAEVRYNSTAGYIQPNTLFAIDTSTMATAGSLTAAKLAKGQSAFGISGTYTSDANATAAQILANQTAYVNGSKVTGTMTNRGTWNGTCATNSSVTIPGGYHSGSGKVSNTQAKLAGYTITPSTSKQTVSCNGKLMTSNIIVNAIPSSYVNPTSGGAFFNNGSYGPMAGGLGAYICKAGGGKSYLSTLSNSMEAIISNNVEDQYIIFRQSLDVSKFKRIVAVVNISSIKKGSLYLFVSRYLGGGTDENRNGTSVSGSNATITVTLPSGISTSKKWCVGFRPSSTTVIVFRVISVIAYAS